MRTGSLSRLPANALFLVASLAVALACSESVTSPVVVDGLRSIEPRAEWREVYGEVESCTEREGSFDRVEWFRASSIDDTIEGGDPAGAWLGPDRPHGIAIHRTRLARGGERLLATVRHESIHEVLQRGSHEGQVWCRCDGRDHLFPHC